MTKEKIMETNSVPKEQNKEARHKELCAKMHDTYVRKNHDYGDSFHKSFKEWGITAAAVRIEDKFNRFKNLARNPDFMVKNESLEDTLLDMANYCLLTILELQS